MPPTFRDTGTDAIVDTPEARLLANLAPGDNAVPLSVTELASSLKRTVEDRFGHVRVRGEISGYKRAASGHVYCTLKDDGACLDAVMWKGGAGRLAFAPEDGIEVIATGKLTTYPGRSKYQIVIEGMELAGTGALMLLFEKLRARLAAEGLFTQAKRPLPSLPRVIGVVTSPTGAVIRDILHRLEDRFGTHVLVWPVVVQGDGAAAQVSRAIAGFNALKPGGAIPRPDLLIVARGGGSVEDLWAFNEEPVVRAIAGSAIPIISAVGHETDTTLADHAADRRAPTPTAAAEMAVPVRAELAQTIGAAALRLDGAVRRGHALRAERLAALSRLMPKLADLGRPQQQRVDEAAERLRHALRARIDKAGQRMAGTAGALRPALLQRRLDLASGRLATLTNSLTFLDPDAPLTRGYAMVKDGSGELIRSGDAARHAGLLTLRFGKDDEVAATVGDGMPVSRPPARPAAKRAAPTGKADKQGNLF